MSTIITATPLFSETTFSGVRMVISPFYNAPTTGTYPVAIPGVDFNSTGQMGSQFPITITFDNPVDYFEITAKATTTAGKKAIAYDDDGNVLGEMEFGSGFLFSFLGIRRTYGEYISTRRMEIPGVRRIELVPGSQDAFFWGDLKFRSEELAIEHQEPEDGPTDLVVEIPLQIRAVAVPRTRQISVLTEFDIHPAVPVFESSSQSTPSTLQVNALPIRMEEAITDIAKRLTSGKVGSYYDEDRELKTLVNFGDDTQQLLTNWMKDPANLSNSGILAKLYEPLPIQINLKSLVWFSRELSPTLLDQVSVVISPAQEIILYLRPPNRNADVEDRTGVSLNNVTLNDLISSGSTITGSQIIPDNSILEQWYTTALEGVALNIDYTDYNNFVHFSSAENRLTVFRQKLIQMEQLQSSLDAQSAAADAAMFSASISFSGSITNVSESVQFTFMQDLANQKQDIVRGLDGYERFLYYDSGSFSGSLSGLVEDEILEIANVSWPTSSLVPGTIAAVTSSEAIIFYATQSAVAADFDNQNTERLVLNVPAYIQDDADSDAFLTFLDMTGHHFDTIKSYIDQMPEIYDRGVDSKTGLSPELLWTIGKSLGIDLPNQYAITDLINYTVGSASATQKTYSQAIAETWKRFIHNQIYVAKTKGTATGLLALRNTYGVLPQLVRLQESVAPSALFSTGSFELFDELTSVLTFNSGARVEVPFSASLQDPDAIEIRFRDTSFTSSVIMTAYDGLDGVWSLVAKPTGSEVNGRGVLQFITGSDVVVESSIGRFFTGDYFTAMLRRNAVSDFDLTIKSYEDEVFVYEFGPTAITSSVTASWEDTNYIHLADGQYGGLIDEVRVWGEIPTDATFDNHTRFPGLYAGNESTSAGNSLVDQHSFNKPKDLAVVPSQSVTNETPWGGATGSLSASAALGFVASAAYPYQFEWIARQTQRFTANAGGSQYSSNLITIAPPADFKPGTVQFSGSSQIPVLSRDRRIRALPSGSTTIIGDEIRGETSVGFYLTLAETINDSIIRSMGAVDLNQLMGDPLDLYEEQYSALVSDYEFYVDNYSPTFNYNTLVRYTEGLLDGLFEQAYANVPSSTRLITGIVIEPPILERNRVVLNKPLVVDGSNTRRAADARSILATEGSYPGVRYAEADIVGGGLPTSLGDASQLQTNIEDEPVADVASEVSRLESTVDDISRDVLGSLTSLNPIIDLQNENIPFAFITELTDTIDSLQTTIPLAFITQLTSEIPLDDEYNILATAPFYSAVIDADIVDTSLSGSIQFEFPEIKSSDDFENPAATTYFTHPTGSYGILTYTTERIKDNILTDRGVWVKGTVYHTNDVATYIDPMVDTTNWTRVTYLQVPQLNLFRAVVRDGDVALIPFNQPEQTIFMGYSPKHFRYFRNTGTGWVNARYDGCLQTDDTTTDGKPPVEIFPSAEAQLFVKAGKPVQNETDEGGPILEVR